MSAEPEANLILEGVPDRPGPFGNPDGSRAPIENVLSDFVDFHGNRPSGRSRHRPTTRRRA
jgi:hypothetical protein